VAFEITPPSLPVERIYSEVNSKCGSLCAAARLLAGLSAADSQEMLALMSEQAFRLAKSLDDHRQAASRP
jgi:hypothetical protein